MLFYFFMCDDLSFINTMKKTLKPSQKNNSMSRMDEKKLHTQEFQLKGSRGNMRCKLLQKRFTGKNLRSTNTCAICHSSTGAFQTFYINGILVGRKWVKRKFLFASFLSDSSPAKARASSNWNLMIFSRDRFHNSLS